MPKTAVVLFNLGGPDEPEAIRPFLFNLFNDRAIVDLPTPVRWPLAKLLTARREPTAQRIYAELGGGSPLLPNTLAQAAALQEALADLDVVRVFTCMRYWHPMSAAVAGAVAEFGPDQIVLLPLYPQFSSTTTGSSFTAWRRAAAVCGLRAETKLVCCYPTEPGFVGAAAASVAAGMRQASAGNPGPVRLLFSAHGLPEKIVAKGDPYPAQVEATAAAIAAALGLAAGDWVVCYQSPVGPLAWIGPATDGEIARAGRDGAAVVLCPVAFVSEHSETLVELDIEYRRLAARAGVPRYVRVQTVGTAPSYIAGLARLVRAALADERAIRAQDGPRRCAVDQACCLNRAI